MGQDDRDEGHADGECPEHVWELAGVTFGAHGAHEDFACTRCRALLVVSPDELTGRTG